MCTVERPLFLLRRSVTCPRCCAAPGKAWSCKSTVRPREGWGCSRAATAQPRWDRSNASASLQSAGAVSKKEVECEREEFPAFRERPCSVATSRNNQTSRINPIVLPTHKGWAVLPTKPAQQLNGGAPVPGFGYSGSPPPPGLTGEDFAIFRLGSRHIEVSPATQRNVGFRSFLYLGLPGSPHCKFLLGLR